MTVKEARAKAALHVGALYKTAGDRWAFQHVEDEGSYAEHVIRPTYNEARRVRASILTAYANRYLGGLL